MVTLSIGNAVFAHRITFRQPGFALLPPSDGGTAAPPRGGLVRKGLQNLVHAGQFLKTSVNDFRVKVQAAVLLQVSQDVFNRRRLKNFSEFNLLRLAGGRVIEGLCIYSVQMPKSG